MEQNQRRIEEINRKIPQIREINDALFATGRELIRIITSGGSTAQQQIEQLQQNNLGAQEMSRQLLIQNGYPADYLDVQFSCKKCGDTGYLHGSFCSCFNELCGKLSAERLNHNTQLKLSTFDTFSLSYYQGQDRITMENILRYTESYAHSFSRNSESILMFGGTGLGKTHLSLAIADVVLKKGFSVLYDSIVNILRRIEKEHFSRDHDTEMIDLVTSTDLLILDDLGTEYESPFYNSTIYNIINTRLNHGLPTIISTNMNYDAIRRRYEDRVVSRLTSVYTCFEFKGKDVRLQIKRNNTKK